MPHCSDGSYFEEGIGACQGCECRPSLPTHAECTDVCKDQPELATDLQTAALQQGPDANEPPVLQSSQPGKSIGPNTVGFILMFVTIFLLCVLFAAVVWHLKRKHKQLKQRHRHCSESDAPLMKGKTPSGGSRSSSESSNGTQEENGDQPPNGVFSVEDETGPAKGPGSLPNGKLPAVHSTNNGRVHHKSGSSSGSKRSTSSSSGGSVAKDSAGCGTVRSGPKV